LAAIRRSGGIVAWFWSGRLPAPDSPGFAQALASRRFRAVEEAAREQVSIGWVTPADPTGGSFDAEDMRVDKKALPIRWLQIHRDAAEKTRGRRLTIQERRELRDATMARLLPRVLPTVQLVDVLLLPERHTALLFATQKGLRESFGKLFFETFALPLEAGDPYRTALRLGLDDGLLAALEGVQPVRWPRNRQEAAAARPPAPARSRAAAPASEAGAEDLP
jgi:hypothetical protein